MYSIYEIPGIKIGLTSNLKRRTYEMKKAYPDHEMKILYTTDNIKLASMLEQTAQMAFGYPVDPVGYYKYANPETVQKGVDTRKGWKQTEEAKQQISDTAKEYWKTHTHHNKGVPSANKGVPMTDASKNKLKETLKEQFRNGRKVHNKKEFTFEGVLYSCIGDASKATGISPYFLKKATTCN